MTGSGTAADPYIISSAADLASIVDMAAYYEVANDIVLSGTYTPIGTFIAPFTGSFDGKGFTIHNLYINSPASDFQGIFACLNGATVKNIVLANVNITGRSYVGGIAGYTFKDNPTISSCSVQGSITATNYCGGIAGAFFAFAAQTNSTGATDCTFSGTLTCTGSNCGGIVGDVFGGGFPAVAAGDLGTFTRCTSSGAATSSANGYVGGIVGGSGGGITFTDCHSSMTISGLYYVGGIVGLVGGHATFSGCYSSGNITATDPADASAGGLVGLAGHALIMSECYATGNVTGQGDDAGGLIASYGNDSSISKCYATGNVAGLDDCGGLVGAGGTGTVSECFATGDITASDEDCGGLFGFAIGTINDCYARGALNGTDHVGGLIGWNAASLNRCYSTGKVVGTGANVGGLVGSDDGTGVTANSFWDITTSEKSSSPVGSGKTTVQMKTRLVFDAFDLETVWGCTPNCNNGYPCLRSPNGIACQVLAGQIKDIGRRMQNRVRVTI